MQNSKVKEHFCLSNIYFTASCLLRNRVLHIYKSNVGPKVLVYTSLLIFTPWTMSLYGVFWQQWYDTLPLHINYLELSHDLRPKQVSAAAPSPQGHNTSGLMTLRWAPKKAVICFNISAAFTSALPRKTEYYTQSQKLPELFIQVNFLNVSRNI
jgi:hypothetical protein